MDLGQSRRGVDMGPSALRGAGLQARVKQLGLSVEDIGNLEVKQPEEMQVGEKRAKYLQEIAETSLPPSKNLSARVFSRWFSVAIILSPRASLLASPLIIVKTKKKSATSGSTPTAT